MLLGILHENSTHTGDEIFYVDSPLQVELEQIVNDTYSYFVTQEFKFADPKQYK